MEKGTSTSSAANKFKPGLSASAAFNEAAEKPTSAGRILPPSARRVRLKGKKFVITSAQNNTDVHEGFLKSLESFCEKNDAQLLIPRFTYNKKGFTNDPANEEVWYDPKIAKYVFDQPAEITKKLILCGELDISPTAVNPLSGFDNYCQGASGIIAHPKVAMRSLPGLGDAGAHYLYTTGAITQRNYIQKKAGQKAEFHHNYSALLVEVDDAGEFFVRQLAADNAGAFQDLTDKYLPNGKVLCDQRVEAINLGDIHVEKGDRVVEEATFGKGGLMETLQPKYMFLHDLIDFEARNHHNIKDPFFMAEQFHKNATVEGNLNLAAQWLKAHERKDRKDIIVESNHDGAFSKWLRDADAQFDSANVRFWHEASAERHRQIEAGNPEFNIFEWALRRSTDLKQATFLRENDSFIICKNDTDGGIESGIHGHSGPNGARGSPNGFRSLATKVNTGHTHSAGIIDGVYTAGVSGKLDMGYNKGPSSWSHSHIVTYPNGKRAIITVKDGKWKADDKKRAAAPQKELDEKKKKALKI